MIIDVREITNKGPFVYLKKSMFRSLLWFSKWEKIFNTPFFTNSKYTANINFYTNPGFLEVSINKIKLIPRA